MGSHADGPGGRCVVAPDDAKGPRGGAACVVVVVVVVSLVDRVGSACVSSSTHRLPSHRARLAAGGFPPRDAPARRRRHQTTASVVAADARHAPRTRADDVGPGAVGPRLEDDDDAPPGRLEAPPRPTGRARRRRRNDATATATRTLDTRPRAPRGIIVPPVARAGQCSARAEKISIVSAPPAARGAKVRPMADGTPRRSGASSRRGNAPSHRDGQTPKMAPRRRSRVRPRRPLASRPGPRRPHPHPRPDARHRPDRSIARLTGRPSSPAAGAASRWPRTARGGRTSPASPRAARPPPRRPIRGG